MEHLVVPEGKEFLKNKQANQKHDNGVSKGHRSQLEELPMAVAKHRSNKVSKVVLDYNSKYTINTHEFTLTYINY